MKNLEDIWSKLNAGDIVLKQTINVDNEYDKPELVIIVGIDIWDMASVVYYTKYKDFNSFLDIEKEPKIYSFPEWSEYWNILGHWKTMPKFKQLLKAIRKSK